MAALSDSTEVDSTVVRLRKAGCTRPLGQKQAEKRGFFGFAESGRNHHFSGMPVAGGVFR